MSTPSEIELHSDEIMDLKTKKSIKELVNDAQSNGQKNDSDLVNHSEVDISDGFALDMFGVSSFVDNEVPDSVVATLSVILAQMYV